MSAEVKLFVHCSPGGEVFCSSVLIGDCMPRAANTSLLCKLHDQHVQQTTFTDCNISMSMLGAGTTLTLKVLVTTIDAQWEGMGDVGSARYEPALLPHAPTIRVLSYSS